MGTIKRTNKKCKYIPSFNNLKLMFKITKGIMSKIQTQLKIG